MTRGRPGGSLPSGVVTFVFTDIGGSTRLFQRWGDGWRDLLARHDDIVLSAITSAGGQVVSHEGDGVFAVFAEAAAAVRAVASAQRELAAHPWPPDGEIRIRAGLHTGYAVPADGSYVALAVHQAARVMQAAQPGQTLLTDTTAPAAGDLPDGLDVVALGAHRLKDFDVPQRLFELRGPGLPSGLSPAAGRWRGATNLPLPRSSFIGRADDVDRVRSLISRARLVTIVGPGGCGKTRLALQAAASLLDGSADGVWVVELADLADGALVAASVLRALNVGEEPGRALVDTLVDALRDRRLLIVLDNCEHVIDGCAEVVDRLLTECAQVVVLATSRQPLDISDEHVFRLPPLDLPPDDFPVTADEALEYEALALFVERARAHDPSFVLDDTTVTPVASICRRLEGLPLAIELAAARMRTLPVHVIAARVDDQLGLLVGTQRTAAPRQQTVRALVEWSYDLLDADEQQLLRHLSVFRGGWSLDAAAAVAGEPDENAMLARLSSLVDKSLVQADAVAGEVRYSLLETVRQYADDRLRRDAPGEIADLVARHRSYFLAFAEEARSRLNTRDQRTWLERLDRDDGNLRIALVMSLNEPVQLTDAMRFVAALSTYWVMRGRAAEGLQLADRVLTLEGAQAGSVEYIATLTSVAALLIRAGEFARARGLLDEATALARDLGDDRRTAIALNDLAWLANRREDLDEARDLAGEALRLAISAGDDHLVGRVQATLGDLEERCGDLVAGRAHFEEARRRFDIAGDLSGSAKMLNNLGLIDLALDDRVRARSALERCLAIFSELQDASSLPTVLVNLGLIAVQDGDHERAVELYERGLRLGHRSRDKELMVYATLGLALATEGLGDGRRAAALHGITDALCADLGMTLDSLEEGFRAAAQARLTHTLGADAWDEAYRTGAAMDVDEAVAFAVTPGREEATASA